MTAIERRLVRFTGARTGLAGMFVAGEGVVHVGQEFELKADVAARWTTLLPTTDGEASDFEYVVAPPPPNVPTAPVVTASEPKPEVIAEPKPEAPVIPKPAPPAQVKPIEPTPVNETGPRPDPKKV